jgi:glycosyltransferase involved in cell wall biosynthesis
MTLNEERQIERCLQSIQGIVDEIVVVDSFSTDCTREICAHYNVRFIEHAFEGYIEQRRWGATQTRNDMVLFLDADEVLSDELRATILRKKEKFKADGYYFVRITFIGNKPIKHGSWYPDYKLRLLDKRRAIFGGLNPHDTIFMSESSRTKRIKAPILHYSFDTIEDFYRQSNKFAKISAQTMYNRGKKISPVMLILKTIWAFCHGYIIKFGFLDGKDGLTISCVIAASTYSKYNQLRKLQKNTARQK